MSKQELNKELYSNLREALGKVISGWIEQIDTDENFVVYEAWDGETKYRTYKVGYTYDGRVANLSGDPEEVVVKMAVEPVKDSAVMKTLRALSAKVDSLFKSAEPEKKQVPVIKQLDDEEMVAIEPLYLSFGEIDGHGDTLESKEEVYKMVASLNQAIADGNLKSNYDHGQPVEDFTTVKAWVNECECYIGDTLVPEGQPIVKTKFTDPVKWEERKSGKIMGVSIQALADIEEVE